MKTSVNEKIKILIADDHAILRDGLAAALESDKRIEIIGMASNGKEALEKVEEFYPDIILLDINMPEMDGLAVAKTLKKKYSQLKILILTMYDNKQFILEALSLDLHGFVLKMAPLEELKKAIFTVYQGEQYFDSEMTISFLSGKIGSYKDEIIYTSDRLTERENQIIGLIVNGNTSTEIAKKLSISKSTVNNHRSNIFRKLDISSSNELIRLALKDGLFKL